MAKSKLFIKQMPSVNQMWGFLWFLNSWPSTNLRYFTLGIFGFALGGLEELDENTESIPVMDTTLPKCYWLFLNLTEVLLRVNHTPYETARDVWPSADVWWSAIKTCWLVVARLRIKKATSPHHEMQIKTNQKTHVHAKHVQEGRFVMALGDLDFGSWRPWLTH